MEIKDLHARIPNLQLIIQNTCKTSMTGFSSIEHPDIQDKQILCWSPASRLIKKVIGVNFYRHPVLGVIVFDTRTNTIFIKNQNGYKIWKKMQNIKKNLKK